MKIIENMQELMERMGSETTPGEAARMRIALLSRGIETFDELDADLSDDEFFSLIPLCISAD